MAADMRESCFSLDLKTVLSLNNMRQWSTFNHAFVPRTIGKLTDGTRVLLYQAQPKCWAMCNTKLAYANTSDYIENSESVKCQRLAAVSNTYIRCHCQEYH